MVTAGERKTGRVGEVAEGRTGIACGLINAGQH